jgi:hypothetical protein
MVAFYWAAFDRTAFDSAGTELAVLLGPLLVQAEGRTGAHLDVTLGALLLDADGSAWRTAELGATLAPAVVVAGAERTVGAGVLGMLAALLLDDAGGTFGLAGRVDAGLAPLSSDATATSPLAAVLLLRLGALRTATSLNPASIAATQVLWRPSVNRVMHK